MPEYPLDFTALAAGSEAWGDSVPVYDVSAANTQSSAVAQKEMTLKEVMLGSYATTYDASGTQALSTNLAAYEAGAAWDGTMGPAAYNATITATTFDGITPTIGGIYEVFFSCNWITAAAHTVTFAFYHATTAFTGAQIQSMSVTETASQYQAVSLKATLALVANEEIRVFVKCATGTPTLTARDVILGIKRLGPSA